MASYVDPYPPQLRDLQELAGRQKNVTDGLGPARICAGDQCSHQGERPDERQENIRRRRKSPPPSTKLSLRQTI